MDRNESGLERKVVFSPSFDKRDSDPSKNYGIGAVRIFFYLIGPKGAVQWAIGTNWYVESAAEHIEASPPATQHLLENMLGGSRYSPQAWDLGFHSPVPMYDGQEPMGGNCEVLGGPCYYDGSTLNAERLLPVFLAEGSEGVWRELEAYYEETFNGGEDGED